MVSGKTWTDTKGRTFEGVVVRQTESTVTILNAHDEREYTIDKSVLSKKDQASLANRKTDRQLSILKNISANEIEYIDFMNTFLGFIILWSFGHLFAFQDWSIWRLICLNLLQALSVFFIGGILALCIMMVDQVTSVLFIGIPIGIYLLLLISSRYLHAGLLRTFAYYVVSYVVIALIMFLLVSLMAVIPF